jgi:hypothetical protein
MRERIMEILVSAGPSTPDAIASFLSESILSVRPRFSELRAAGRIKNTGDRGITNSGKSCIIWRAEKQ